KVQISVYMCNDAAAQAATARCTAGAVTQSQSDQIKQTLKDNGEVKDVYYESQEEAFKRFKEIFKDASTTPYVRAKDMNAAFRVSLKNPQEYQGVVSSVQGLPGVSVVQDSRQVLEPLFKGLNGLQWLSIGLAAGLLIAAVLQIGNTIRLTVFSRRRE